MKKLYTFGISLIVVAVLFSLFCGVFTGCSSQKPDIELYFHQGIGTDLVILEAKTNVPGKFEVMDGSWETGDEYADFCNDLERYQNQAREQNKNDEYEYCTIRVHVDGDITSELLSEYDGLTVTYPVDWVLPCTCLTVRYIGSNGG